MLCGQLVSWLIPAMACRHDPQSSSWLPGKMLYIYIVVLVFSFYGFKVLLDTICITDYTVTDMSTASYFNVMCLPSAAPSGCVFL